MDKPQSHSSRSDAPASRRGFTIVELVIAIAVSAMVIVTVSTALSRISKTRDVARTRLDAVTRANAALDAVRRDLVSVVRDGDLFYSRVLLFDGASFTPYGMMGRDEILVFNNRLRPMRRDDYAGEGGEYESQYRIEEDSSGSVLWLRRDAVPDELVALPHVQHHAARGKRKGEQD
jgi:prepilin-type N-terminal cleavage/methylation domain-containing protein